jgi:hypothetical protein
MPPLVAGVIAALTGLARRGGLTFWHGWTCVGKSENSCCAQSVEITRAKNWDRSSKELGSLEPSTGIARAKCDKDSAVFSWDFLQTPSVPQGAVKDGAETCTGFGGKIGKKKKKGNGEEMGEWEEEKKNKWKTNGREEDSLRVRSEKEEGAWRRSAGEVMEMRE